MTENITKIRAYIISSLECIYGEMDAPQVHLIQGTSTESLARILEETLYEYRDYIKRQQDKEYSPQIPF